MNPSEFTSTRNYLSLLVQSSPVQPPHHNSFMSSSYRRWSSVAPLSSEGWLSHTEELSPHCPPGMVCWICHSIAVYLSNGEAIYLLALAPALCVSMPLRLSNKRLTELPWAMTAGRTRRGRRPGGRRKEVDHTSSWSGEAVRKLARFG